jgi:Tol biopolymer transport system component
LDEIYARHPDGSGGHVVVLPHLNVTYPSVAPDGSSIVYQSPTDGTLYVYRFGAASDVALATGPIGPNGASISPDGALVVFPSGNGIAVVAADGTGAAQNVGSLHGSSAPVFTGDSQSIVFKTDKLIESARIDSGDVAVLVDTGGDPNAETAISNPAFSPDYENLAAVVICAGQNAPLTLRTYSFASLPAPCTSGRDVTVVRYGAPAWGPTGLIAYADAYDVFLVNATGGTPTNLTSDLTATASSVDCPPTWAPACTKL